MDLVEIIQVGWNAWVRGVIFSLSNPYYLAWCIGQVGITLFAFLFRYRITEFFMDRFPQWFELEDYEGETWANEQYKKKPWWKE